MSKALQSELDWITKNVALYDSPMHAEAVKRNIEKRYQIAELQAKVKQLEEQLDVL